MGKRIQRTVEPIQLDVDWLLGKRADPRLRLHARRTWLSRLPMISIGILSVLGLIVAWPGLSNRWLLQELRRALATSNGIDESLGLIVALNELGATSTKAMVEQLDSDEPQHRLAAYQLLHDRIHTAASSDDRLQSCLSLISELAAANLSSNDSMRLRERLSFAVLSRLEECGSSDSVEKAKATCRSILALQSSPANDATRSIPPVSGPRIEDVAAMSPGENANGTKVQSKVISAGGDRDIPLPRLPQPSIATPLTTTVAISSPKSVSGVEDHDSKVDDVSSAASNPLRGAQVMLVSSEATSSSSGESYSQRADGMDLAGLESLSLENLFTLLSSTQERRVRMVCDELFRRGVPTEIVEIAIDMARGDSQVQLDAMEQAVRGRTINPVPLLAWMAQSQDRNVRHRAITLLGAMQDRDAHLKLRSLFQREPDKQLQQMIQQALVAGTGSHRGSVP